MTDSAFLKINRAAKHLAELNEFLSKNRPFALVIKTNTQTGERSIGTKKNEAAISDIALICGDVIHNLRSALDHVYWEIVSPHCTSDKERRVIQFPFTSKATELRKTLIDAYANRAGTGFFCAMLRLRPHGENGGNEMLSLIREADNLDKHRLLIPSIDYTKATGDQWRAAFPPDIPINMGDGTNVTMALSSTTIKWTTRFVPAEMLGTLVPPSHHLFEREIKIPTEIVLKIGQVGSVYPMISTLKQMIDMARETVLLLRRAAVSY